MDGVDTQQFKLYISKTSLKCEVSLEIPMADEISTKNTKNEILEAYHEALQQLKESKKATKQEIKASDDRKEIVTLATKSNTGDIFKSISELKLAMVKSLEDIEEKLLSSHKKLSTLNQAIEIQTKELADLHDIKINTDSLSALLFAQKEKRASFEKEMQDRQQTIDQEITQRRLLWKKEQDEMEIARKEYDAQVKKSRQREEEDYLYQRDVSRKKERDQYSAEKELLEKELIMKRAALESEFSQRAQAIAAQEQEYSVLKAKADAFPAELQKAIQDTSNAITERLSFKFGYETKLAQKEVEGERKLYQQMITALEAKVSLLETQTAHLTDKTNQANLQVQDIAVKAIEGASRHRYAPSFSEKMLEQLKPQ